VLFYRLASSPDRVAPISARNLGLGPLVVGAASLLLASSRDRSVHLSHSRCPPASASLSFFGIHAGHYHRGNHTALYVQHPPNRSAPPVPPPGLFPHIRLHPSIAHRRSPNRLRHNSPTPAFTSSAQSLRGSILVLALTVGFAHLNSESRASHGHTERRQLTR